MKKLLAYLTFIVTLVSCSGGAEDSGITISPVTVSPPTSSTTSTSTITGALPQNSPLTSWTNPGSFDHVEVALGTTSGGDEVISWTDNSTNTSYTFNALTGLTECSLYYPSIKALDSSSNESTVETSAPFYWDNSIPTGLGVPDVSADNATNSASTTITWTSATDNCTFDHYEIAVGTTSGATDIQGWIDIGSVVSYRVTNGVDGASFSLSDSTNYFITLKAVDEAGNEQIQNSAAFQVFNPVVSLPNMVLRLDASDLTSVVDSAGNDATSGLFNGSVDFWNDTSASANTHNFYDYNTRPSYDGVNNHIDFNGTNQALTVTNHTDLNTGTVNQRNITVSFETSSDITSRQVIYEEGGAVRGMNVYIDSGNLYCGFWNDTEDGDGVQAFVDVNTPVAANSIYHVTWVFDYTNYTGAAGPDGSLECYVNSVSIGTQSSTSLLYAHSGAVGIGAMVNDTFYHDGAGSGYDHYFQGSVMEVMLFNDPPTATSVNTIHDYLNDKWN